MKPRASLPWERELDDVTSGFESEIMTSDGHTIILSRYTQPETDLQLLLKQLKLGLPDQPPPKITASHRLAK